MEYCYLVLAALLAGIGTGLAGLSAATVMVPILITLCPSFSGETGAYQATAIALASDILGSAVTTATYIRHRNIDLKRGFIMLICILTMCVGGSIAAYAVGNVVLGSFSLFLMFFIGIRFLVKPETEHRDLPEKGTALGPVEIAVSLFFGLTIGFGTGFVGTGGGMMMLIVFTAFLRMNYKTAVGTSTFIMTGTALIASVSHIFMEPAIVLERWDALLICVAVATVSSLVSARFANRVKSRTVSLCTGGVLTVLGAAMLLLYYWDIISRWTLTAPILSCCSGLLVTIGIGIAVLLPIRFIPPLFGKKFPDFIFRKLLHLVAFSSILVMMRCAGDAWLAACITALLFAAVIYPFLRLLEPCGWFRQVLLPKHKGETAKSLMLLFLPTAVLIAVLWGAMQRPWLAMAAIIMWGTGDAAAALIGIPFGRHKIKWRRADGKKSLEGTLAAGVTAFLVGWALLSLWSPYGLGLSAVMAVVTAPVTAFVELFSHDDADTVTVPAATGVMLLILALLVEAL